MPAGITQAGNMASASLYPIFTVATLTRQRPLQGVSQTVSQVQGAAGCCQETTAPREAGRPETLEGYAVAAAFSTPLGSSLAFMQR